MDARDQLQGRLADLDQKAVTLSDPPLALDAATAKSLGVYDKVKAVADERADVEGELAKLATPIPRCHQRT